MVTFTAVNFLALFAQLDMMRTRTALQTREATVAVECVHVDTVDNDTTPVVQFSEYWRYGDVRVRSVDARHLRVAGRCVAPQRTGAVVTPVPHYPMPTLHMHLGREAPCDVFVGGSAASCRRFTQSAYAREPLARSCFEPEAETREVYHSVLYDCAERGECRVLDLGANVGFFVAYAAALGAELVVGVEPTPVYNEVLPRSVAAQCGRADLVHAFITPDPAQRGRNATLGSAFAPCHGRGPVGVTKPRRKRPNTNPKVPFVVLEDLLNDYPFHWTLIKLDIDSIEGLVVQDLVRLLETGLLTFRTLLVEWGQRHGRPEDLRALQQRHGYDVYVLNTHVDRRHYDWRGHDVYALHNGPDDELEAAVYEERWFALGVHMAYYVRPTNDTGVWRRVSDGMRKGLWHSVLATRAPLYERSYPHPSAAKHPTKQVRPAEPVPLPHNVEPEPWRRRR